MIGFYLFIITQFLLFCNSLPKTVDIFSRRMYTVTNTYPLKGNSIMKIAFAGLRHDHIFAVHKMALAQGEYEITGAFEENDAARERAETAFGVNCRYPTYEALLSDDTVEAVALGGCYAHRGAMAVEALKAGKHVLADKPLCTDLTTLAEIERLADETGKKVSGMFTMRYEPKLRAVVELVKSGALGEINNIYFGGQHPLNYGVRPMWYFEDGKHGGTINDIAIHGVDLVRFITGKNLTKIDCAKTWNAYAVKAPNFKDCGQFMVDMEGMAVTADVSYSAPRFNGILPTYWDFYFWGTEGMIHFNMAENKTCLYKDGACQTFECEFLSSRYFEDLPKMIQGAPALLNTKDILASQRQVLMIQKAAEQN